MRASPATYAMFLAVVVSSVWFLCAAQSSAPTKAPAMVSGVPVLQPEELVRLLQAQKGEKPLVLNVGPRLLYLQAHIPAAEYMGAGSDERGLQQLRERVRSLPRNKSIVLYCGCCPWSHCPNVIPAYKALQTLGFTQARVLYIGDNFGTDWVYKGYPVARGE